MAAPEDLYNEILADGPSPGTLFRLLLKMKHYFVPHRNLFAT